MTNYLFSVFQDERFMDLTVYQYGYEQCEPLHSFGPYVRNNYLFLLQELCAQAEEKRDALSKAEDRWLELSEE